VSEDDDGSGVFGLDNRTLRPVVEAAAGERVASFDVVTTPLTHGHYGAEGDKRIAACRYHTASGGRGSATIFCKRCNQPGLAEAHHYEHLRQVGIPLARCYGYILDGQGREILFLEKLETVFHDNDLLGQPESCIEFLQLLAQLNAAAVSEAYGRTLHRADIGGFVSGTLGALDEACELAGRGVLGSALQHLLAARTADRLKDLATSVAAAASASPHGWIHGDYFPRHVGRRASGGELLTFDLVHAGLGARFFDVATFVGGASQSCSLCLPVEQAAAVYTEAYAAAGGPRVGIDEFLKEARTTWLAWNFRCMRGWVARASDGDSASREELAGLLGVLLDNGAVS
jgi:hypothetical protein